MKKRWSALCAVIFLLLGMGLASAQPEPVYRVEMSRKPGIDFRQFKSVGNEVSVSIRSDSDWAIDKKNDPFLRQRIRDITLKAAKNQGWVPVDNVDADVKLSVKILEWSRVQNARDNNLMENVTFELRAYSDNAVGLVFRGTGNYSRVDPVEPDLNMVREAYRTLMEELLAALHVN